MDCLCVTEQNRVFISILLVATSFRFVHTGDTRPMLDSREVLPLGSPASPINAVAVMNANQHTVGHLEDSTKPNRMLSIINMLNDGGVHNYRHKKDINRSINQEHSRKSQRGHKGGGLKKRRGIKQKSCSTKTRYVFKKTAEDIFGDTVKVHPVLKVGNVKVNQYFYESFCAEEMCTCIGVDPVNFKSSCETIHSYTYARVVKNGHVGWTFIKVRSGCSCSVRKDFVSIPKSILDFV